jgi:hypothetical protein
MSPDMSRAARTENHIERSSRPPRCSETAADFRKRPRSRSAAAPLAGGVRKTPFTFSGHGARARGAGRRAPRQRPFELILAAAHDDGFERSSGLTPRGFSALARVGCAFGYRGGRIGSACLATALGWRRAPAGRPRPRGLSLGGFVRHAARQATCSSSSNKKQQACHGGSGPSSWPENGNDRRRCHSSGTAAHEVRS